jgi:uncharacterized membrane protein (UPF0136 family)
MGIIATIAYGLLSIAGGILGYAKAKSKVSLISGLVSGLALMLCGLLQFQDQAWARFVAIAITGILTIVFVVRFQKTRKWMPAGMMVGLGIVALVLMVVNS